MPEHTIAENLARLQAAKTAIGNAITSAGGTVNTGDGFEDFASDVGSITTNINTTIEAVNGSLDDSLNGSETVSKFTTKNITDNGTYTATDDNALGYSSVTVKVPVRGYNHGGVNFFDIDGNVLYSYTKEEFAELEALPP